MTVVPTLFPGRPLLIVDDEEHFLRSLTLLLRSQGFTNIVTCRDGAAAREHLVNSDFSAIVLDVNLPGIRGTRLLDTALDSAPQTPVIMVTAVDRTDIAVACIKKGALDYLVKPLDEEKLLNVIRYAVERRELCGENEALKEYLLESQLKHPQAFSAIVTRNRRMLALFQYVEAIAPSPFPVLITGETGSGKELFARALHDLSRRSGPFVTVNVAGIDENTFSDTLFGHVRGAFTGADQARSGLVEHATGGTLFLDEIGDLAQGSQIKLLRVIQNRDYIPLGADAAKLADTRIIVATNRTIDELKNTAAFRSDLYHRLRTHHVAIPPLRERMDDIDLLTEAFLDEAARVLKKNRPPLHPSLPPLLRAYDYPGNVRELQAMIVDALSVHTSGPLGPELFEEQLGTLRNVSGVTTAQHTDNAGRFPTIQEAVQELIAQALARTSNNQNAAARLLGISPQALSKRLKLSKETGTAAHDSRAALGGKPAPS